MSNLKQSLKLLGGSNFKIIARDGRARVGLLQTGHGEVKTPIFMPVGTQGSVKALSPDDLKEAGAQIILGNTYHLYLRPGHKLIKKLGGLHKFMNWDGPILTDSGGFQAFSLGAMIEHGVKKVPSQSKEEGSDKRIEIRGQGLENKKGEEIVEERIRRIRKSGRVFVEKDKKIIRHITEFLEKGDRRRGEEGANKNYRISDQFDIVKLNDNREKVAGNREKKGSGKEGKNWSKILTNGVEFKSHLDGSTHLLTPQLSIEVQLALGSDIVLVLDELLSPLHDFVYVKESLERTHRWELESQKYFKTQVKKSVNPSALLFGILQGVYDRKIRENEAKWIAKQGFDGISIGGSFGTSEIWRGPSTLIQQSSLSSDEFNWAATRAIYETVGWVTPLLPDELPRHILGIGEVVDLFECIERGADMFDCVSPTRRARNGSLYISPRNGGKEGNKFTISIGRSAYSEDPNPIDPGCECYSCQNFSRAYLKHLYMAKEILFHRLATIHNVYFILHLVDRIREAIENKQFEKLKASWLK